MDQDSDNHQAAVVRATWIFVPTFAVLLVALIVVAFFAPNGHQAVVTR